MAKKKIWKKVIIILIIILIILLYELIGVLAAYAHQPIVSEKTKQETQIEKFFDATAGSPERAAVIEDNQDALEQRMRLIHNAKESIVLSTFAFHSDESGKIVIGALLDAADRGVKVQVLVDGFESWTAMEGNPYFYALSSHHNTEVKLYNKANPLKPWKIMGRMHDKYLIADHQVYLLGGRNTYNYFLGDFPGHKNFDRDVFVYCENPQKENSINQLQEYFETVWNDDSCRYFHKKEKLKTRNSVRKAIQDVENCYQSYVADHESTISDEDYKRDTFETEQISLISNPIHTQAKEPVVWYQLGELMKNAQERVVIHTPYIICNEMMYDTWKKIAENVPDFSVMTNSTANNGNPFGSADYDKNRDKILDTGIDIWEYEGGYSYHGKSILIDDDISVVGSFNMDMRSTYLDTELMLVIRSKEVNQQLGENMKKYEMDSRQVRDDGTYYNPYDVEPITLTKKRAKRIWLVQKSIGRFRFLF